MIELTEVCGENDEKNNFIFIKSLKGDDSKLVRF